MTTIVSQITSLTIVYLTVYSDANQRKHQSSASLAFVWGIHRDRWIPRTKGQLRGKCFHLMTSSCLFAINIWLEMSDITHINVAAYQYHSNLLRGKCFTLCTTLTSYECHGVSNHRQLDCLLNNLFTEPMVAYFQLDPREQIEVKFWITTILCRQNAFENIVCNVTIIFTRSQCVMFS